MKFDPTAYGPVVAAILELDGNGERLMPLFSAKCSSPKALTKIDRTKPELLFPNARAPHAALSGLYLYFSCLDRSHEIAQSIDSPEGSFWHGVVHRQEPDADNARYWFRKVGAHQLFPDIAKAAGSIARRFPEAQIAFNGQWDPFRFIDICEHAQSESNTPLAQMALEVQRAEWQLLFDHCARAGSAEL